MSENMNELYELEELKATYHLMDERLDGQEIVSDEQLRETMVRKFTDMRQNAKEALIWGNLILVPLLVWHDWANSQLTLLGMILLGVYWVASLIFRFIILRRTKKENYGGYDLKTLVEKESRYSKNIKWVSIVILIFWMVYFVQMFIIKGKNGMFVFIFMTLALMIPLTIRWLVIKFKYNGQTIDPATGKPRVLGGKRFMIVMYTLLGLVVFLYLISFILNIINGSGLLGLMRGLNMVSILIAITTLILGSLHQRNKITVSRRLLIVLTVIAIAVSASVVGIATLKDIAEFTQSTSLLMTACLSSLGLFCHKMRK